MRRHAARAALALALAPAVGTLAPGGGALGAAGMLGTAGSLAALGALAGCASAPSTGPAWTTGRLALRVEATDGRPASALSAGFELRGDGERGELRLSGALGAQLAAARWAPGEAVLVTSAGEERHPTLDALAEQALGERVPLAALPDWIAGRPWAGAPSAAIADGFEQLGWRIVTAARAEGRIAASRAAAAGRPSVTLRVVLDDPR